MDLPCAQIPAEQEILSEADNNERINNIVRAASLLYTNGQTTRLVVSETIRLANAYGYEAHIQPQWDAIHCRFRPLGAHSQAWRFEMINNARPTGVDMNKVTLTNRLIDRISQQSESITQAQVAHHSGQFKQIASLKPCNPVRFVVMAGFGAVALGLIFGATNWSTISFIFLAAMIGATLRQVLSRLSDNLFVQAFVAALAAGVVGGIAQRLFNEVFLQFAVIAPCMILVPGPHILNASLDLLRGRIGLGVSRMVYASMILLSICAGLLIGLLLVNSTLTESMIPAKVPLWLDMLAAGVAIAAFGAFFSLTWAMLSVPILVGMFCHASHWWILQNGGGVALATLVACLISGTVTTFLSRKMKIPFAALAFCTIVSMMPGIYVFKFASSVVDIYLAGDATSLNMLNNVVSYGVGTLIIVMAMTFGLIVPKMLIDSLKPVEG